MRCDKVIVLEDDLVTSPHFLQYMNDGLGIYERDDRVISIHGYSYPVHGKLPETFFLRGADCLGWATWKRGWDLFEDDGQRLLNELERRNLTRSFDFDGSYPYTQMLRDQIAGSNSSWAVRWYASAFLRDKLKFPYTDVGEGWLVFDLPEADMGCHPADPVEGAPAGTHNISFYCDDIQKTVAELKAREVEFTDGIIDAGYGLVTHFKMPGDLEVQLYQPRYKRHTPSK